MYGLNCLTGEACAFGQRLLFDVNAEGRNLLCDFLGVASIDLQPNWNSSVNTDLAIGSIMLTADTAWNLVTFALLSVDKYSHVIPHQLEHHGAMGFDVDSEIALEYLQKAREHYRVIVNTTNGVSRNVHQFTGRTI
jgi:hypothetical protein